MKLIPVLFSAAAIAQEVEKISKEDVVNRSFAEVKDLVKSKCADLCVGYEVNPWECIRPCANPMRKCDKAWFRCFDETKSNENAAECFSKCGEHMGIPRKLDSMFNKPADVVPVTENYKMFLCKSVCMKLDQCKKGDTACHAACMAHVEAAVEASGCLVDKSKAKECFMNARPTSVRPPKPRPPISMDNRAYKAGFAAGEIVGADSCWPLGYDNWSEGASWMDYDMVNDKAQVHLPGGYMQGRVQDNSMHFNGIRYAAKPTRFMHSTSPDSWKGVFQATKDLTQIPGCIVQYADHKEADDNDGRPDVECEDCLFMNIVTPTHESLAMEGKRPVIVVVHGGGWKGNTGASDNIYNGNRIANEEGAIVVTINYRHGALGWFRYSPAGPYAPGNQGLSDVIQALRWVKMNIGHFYGDADSVTLLGHSSGADVVSNILAMNPNHAASSENLVHRAILLSAPWMAPGRDLGDSYGQADIIGGQLMLHTKNADGLPCAYAGGEEQNVMLIFGCMQNVDPTAFSTASGQIQEMQPTGGDNPYTGQPEVKVTTMISEWGVTIDGDMLDMQNFDAWRTGRIWDVPVMMGATSGDGVTFVFGFVHQNMPNYMDVEQAAPGGAFSAIMSTVWKDAMPDLLGANVFGQAGTEYYTNPCPDGPMGGMCDNRVTLGLQFGDFFFKCPLQHYVSAPAFRNRGSDTFLYMFDQPQTSTLESRHMRQLCTMFSCHSSDVAYWFGSFDKDVHNSDEDDLDIMYNVDADDWELSNRMRNALGNFAWNSDPNVEDRPAALDDLESIESTQSSCWPKANDHTSCGNADPATFNPWHRFYAEGRYESDTDVTMYKGEQFAALRCSFWEDLDRYGDF